MLPVPRIEPGWLDMCEEEEEEEEEVGVGSSGWREGSSGRGTRHDAARATRKRLGGADAVY